MERTESGKDLGVFGGQMPWENENWPVELQRFGGFYGRAKGNQSASYDVVSLYDSEVLT